jgi:hypothetical protein
MTFSFGIWDVALLIAVSMHATVIAYVADPRAKAALLALPVPFTLAVLAVGRGVDVTHAMGPLAVLLFTHFVRVLHQRLRWPIVGAIAVAVLAYLVIGMAGERFVPKTGAAFWSCCAVNLLIGAWLHARRTACDEPAHRSALPLAVKLPIIMSIIAVLLMLKRVLGGFVPTFPMVGVIACYETRKSLRTTCQAIPLNLIILSAMLATCRLTQSHIGLPGALAAAWVVLLVVGTPLLKTYLRAVVNTEPAAVAREAVAV